MSTDKNKKKNVSNDTIHSVNHSTHSEWLVKYNKTKKGRIFNLLHDIKSDISHHNLRSSESKMQHLSAALFIITNNTQYEDDINEIIQILCPSFFSD